MHPPTPDTAFPDRYSRQVLFPGIGPAGQALLAQATVALIGVGATGAATASLLARAGVGTLILIDRDFVEPSNLQRQVLFDEADALHALPKAEAARRKIGAFNSTITVIPHVTDLVPANIHSLLAPAQLVLDCTDNFETRYLLNDYAVQQAKPWIYAAAVAAYAATMTILPRPATDPGTPGLAPETWNPLSPAQHLGAPGLAPETWNPLSPAKHLGAPGLAPETWNPLSPAKHLGAPGLAPETWDPHPPTAPTACLACIFPTPPTGTTDTCDTAGILPTAVNLAASIQANEALKLLTRQPHLIRRTLLSFDLWTNQRSEISTSTPNPACPVCGPDLESARTFTYLAGTARPHITLCGRNSVQIHEHARPIDLAALHTTLAAQPEITALRSNAMLLRFTRGPHTLTIFPDGRALIQGTTDPATARSLYSRFIGS